MADSRYELILLCWKFTETVIYECFYHHLRRICLYFAFCFSQNAQKRQYILLELLQLTTLVDNLKASRLLLNGWSKNHLHSLGD